MKETIGKSEKDVSDSRFVINVLQEFFRSWSAPVIITGNDGKVLFVNESMEKDLAQGADAKSLATGILSSLGQEYEAKGKASFDIGLPMAQGEGQMRFRGVVTALESAVGKVGAVIVLDAGEGAEALCAPSEEVTQDTKNRERMLEVMHKLQADFIGDTPVHTLFQRLLDSLLEITGSQFGFVGRVLYAPDGKPYLKTHAISDISWNPSTKALFKEISTTGLEFRNPKTLFGHALTTESVVISNNPSEDPRAGGLPDGHPKILSFLGAPFKLSGKMVGMAGLANRSGGYDETMVQALEPLLATCASLIDAYATKEERRKTGENLIMAKRMAEKAILEKDKYISLIAHDLKSPFTSILAFLKLLGKGKFSLQDPANRPLFNSIIESSERAAKMIDEVLSLSRLGIGAIKLRPKPLDAHAVAASAVSLHGHMAKNKGIAIRNEIPLGSRIYADPHLFGEVVSNLLSNAIKFSHRGGEVVMFIPQGTPSVVAIKDKGIGINEELLQGIFRHEEKRITEGTEGEKGTGLALPLCKEIMRAHNGDISVESMLGKGATFFARLPERKPVVVVVDDEKIAREAIRSILKSMDLDVIALESGEEALALVKAHPPDLLCLDINMPGANGLDILEALKGLPEKARTPIIVITSDLSVKVRDKALAMGADDFVTKEHLARELEPRVRKFCV